MISRIGNASFQEVIAAQSKYAVMWAIGAAAGRRSLKLLKPIF